MLPDASWAQQQFTDASADSYCTVTYRTASSLTVSWSSSAAFPGSSVYIVRCNCSHSDNSLVEIVSYSTSVEVKYLRALTTYAFLVTEYNSDGAEVGWYRPTCYGTTEAGNISNAVYNSYHVLA